MRDWSKVPAVRAWVAARKKEGEPLRNAVWSELQPLRDAVSTPREHKESRNITRWHNIGCFGHLRHKGLRSVGLKTPWGNIIVKPWGNRLFSERYGSTPHLRLLGLCVTWRRLRQLPTPPPEGKE